MKTTDTTTKTYDDLPFDLVDLGEMPEHLRTPIGPLTAAETAAQDAADEAQGIADQIAEARQPDLAVVAAEYDPIAFDEAERERWMLPDLSDHRPAYDPTLPLRPEISFEDIGYDPMID